MRRLALFFLVLTLGHWPRALPAQEMDVPASVQVPLLFKILTFDRKLGIRASGNDIVIAVVFQTGFRASVIARDQVMEALKRLRDSTISGHPVHWVAVELDDAESLKRTLVRERVDVIYVTPLRGVELDDIITAARSRGVTTFTGVPQYVERGLAIGVGIARERPEIIINLLATRAEGSDFNSQLLRVSKVIQQ